MNELARELESKANSILRECDDKDLQEAAYFMCKAVEHLNAYEYRTNKKEYANERRDN